MSLAKHFASDELNDAIIAEREAIEADRDHLRDALTGFYRLVDRWGWLSGQSMETRDALIAKARAALGEKDHA